MVRRGADGEGDQGGGKEEEGAEEDELGRRGGHIAMMTSMDWRIVALEDGRWLSHRF